MVIWKFHSIVNIASGDFLHLVIPILTCVGYILIYLATCVSFACAETIDCYYENKYETMQKNVVESMLKRQKSFEEPLETHN